MWKGPHALAVVVVPLLLCVLSVATAVKDFPGVKSVAGMVKHLPCSLHEVQVSTQAVTTKHAHIE